MSIVKTANAKYLNRRNALLILILGSLISFLLTPMSEIRTQVVSSLPWVGIGVLVTEGLFILGIGIMAWEAEQELGANPLRWRKKLHSVINKIVRTPKFWVGFWVNTIGALGTAILLGAGIIASFSPQSWLLLWIPLIDIVLTISIRMAAVAAIKASK